MKTIKLSLLFAIGCALHTFGQNQVFVMDSIMNSYMESGYANEHFRPGGKQDADGKRQGNWKDYEVRNDFMYVSRDGVPEQVIGDYLLYGEGKFTDSLRSGVWKFYVLEDKTFRKILQKQVTYTKGEAAGAYTYFYPSGKVSMKGQFVPDVEKAVEMNIYYESGKLFRSTFVREEKLTGKSTTFYPNGKIMVESHYLEDSLNGSYQSFYTDGKKEEVSFFKMGKPDGVYQYYHENGQLWIEKEYQNGLLLNVKASFDEFGKARDFGTLKNGNGTVRYYTRTGEIYNIQDYKDGVMISESASGGFE